jgi:hypothetical protein
MTNLSFAEQRERDALAFDPLPDSRWVRVTDNDIQIKAPYDPAIVAWCRNAKGRWSEQNHRWHFSFNERAKIAAFMPQLNELAGEAQSIRDERIARKDAERECQRQKTEARWAEEDRKRALKAPPRPFRREFLVPQPNSPKHAFRIEAIGENTAKMFGDRGLSGWVAQLFGSCPRKGFQRAFLVDSRDYSSANSMGSRGVTKNYLLEEGPIYEVSEKITWTSRDRYFLRIQNGDRIRMTEDEVRACLESVG